MSAPHQALTRPRGIIEIPTLADLVSLLSVVGPVGDLPITSLRFLSDGRIQKAEGDDSGPLVYSDVGFWLNTDNAPLTASDWEVSLTVDSSGGTDTATYSGNSLATFHGLSSNVTWTLTKDDTTTGSAIKNITVDIRQVSDTGNADADATTSHTVQVTV